MAMTKCVIMAGGKGTRLWPVSRRNKPKQFQCLVSDKTMLQETFLRMRARFDMRDILISTNDEFIAEVEREILELPKNNFVSEPGARGTASSMALAAAIVSQRFGDDTLVAHFPADHLIKNPEVLVDGILAAEKFLETHPDHIVTFGIMPTAPETGFGYIQEDRLIEAVGKQQVFKVKRFVEKPNMEAAQKYIESGTFHWNSGMYIWRAGAIVEKFKKFLPDTYHRLQKIRAAVDTERYPAVLAEEYPQMDNISIEYSVVENDDKVTVMPLPLEWSDVGSWTSLKDTLVSNNGEHYVKGEHVDFESKNLLVYGSKKLITTVGVKDLIIVDSEDAILVCDRNKAQFVSDVVKKLEASGKVTLL